MGVDLKLLVCDCGNNCSFTQFECNRNGKAYKMDERIKLTDTIADVCIKMSEGNPGAITVLCRLIKEGGPIDPDNGFEGMGAILLLDTIGIYGSKIWILYKDRCKQNLSKFIALLRAFQLGFVDEFYIKNLASEYSLDFNEDELNGNIRKVKERLPNFNLQEV